MAKAKKTKKAPPKQKRRSFLSVLFSLAVLCGGIAAGSFYLYVDTTIVARLEYKKPQSLPSVFSEAFEVAPEDTISPTVLKAELTSRSYRETSTSPSKSGEYTLSTTQAVVITRPFVDAYGDTHDPERITFEAQDGRYRNTAIKSLYLEPQLIAHLGTGEMRASTYRPLKEIPRVIQNAVIAIEDERFFSHAGVDLIGIMRATVANLKAMRLVQGGSTLTQQLAKNLLFSPEKTISRKLIEIAAAISIETRYSKEEILELYVNEVYLGQEGSVAVHGFAEGAATIFGKQLEELDLSESAILAGLIQAPSAYSPRRNLERALKRRNLVLEKMLNLGFISEAEESAARLSKPTIADAGYHRSRIAPFFIEATNKELSSYFDVTSATLSGLRVYTGLNRQMQQCAEDAVDSGIAQVEKDHPKFKKNPGKLEVGLVALEPYSGKVRAYVGGRSYSKNQFDHVTQAKRQIGSTVKPFLYITALDEKLNAYKPATAVTILPDEPMSFQFGNQPLWEPANYDKKFRGDVSLRYALEHSLNLPAAYLVTRIGVGAFAQTLRNFRVAESVLAVPSLALGALDSTLLAVTASFGAIANGGNYIPPRLYLSAHDGEGRELARTTLDEQRVADERAIYVLTNILQGTIDRGTATRVRTLGFTREAAGKTGTSNDMRDAWFIGFTPSLVAGVWVGFDDNTEIGITGGQGAVPIWTNFMKCVEPLIDPLTFIPPPGVNFLDVNPATGGLVTTDCPIDNPVREVFIEGTEPPACPEHRERPESVSGGEDLPTIQDTGALNTTPPEAPVRNKRTKGLWDVLFGE
jgi:penicillin-binding protein 1B